MNRRNLIIGGGALLLPQAAKADVVTRPVGEWDGTQFNWRNIDVDYFGRGERQQALEVALDLFGVRVDDRSAITTRIERSPGRLNEPDEVALIATGQRYQAMVSGGILSRHAYVTPNVVAHPTARWSSKVVRVFRVRVNGRRYVFGCPICYNWLIIEAAQFTYECVCRPGIDVGPRCRS